MEIDNTNECSVLTQEDIIIVVSPENSLAKKKDQS
ncbi:Uncharacterised protein [Legionella hackeliae]|nr:Uncharacterised protein [Legionella hackeliae]